jgi:hypothetical protein
MRATVCARRADSAVLTDASTRGWACERDVAHAAAAKMLNTLARRRAADIAGVSHRAPPDVKGW